MSSTPLQAPIKASSIRAAFPGGPAVFRLTDFYSGKPLTSGMIGGAIPASGTIRFSQFIGAYKSSGPVAAPIPAVFVGRKDDGTIVSSSTVGLSPYFSHPGYPTATFTFAILNKQDLDATLSGTSLVVKHRNQGAYSGVVQVQGTSSVATPVRTVTATVNVTESNNYLLQAVAWIPNSVGIRDDVIEYNILNFVQDPTGVNPITSIVVVEGLSTVNLASNTITYTGRYRGVLVQNRIRVSNALGSVDRTFNVSEENAIIEGVAFPYTVRYTQGQACTVNLATLILPLDSAKIRLEFVESSDPSNQLTLSGTNLTRAAQFNNGSTYVGQFTFSAFYRNTATNQDELIKQEARSITFAP